MTANTSAGRTAGSPDPGQSSDGRHRCHLNNICHADRQSGRCEYRHHVRYGQTLRSTRKRQDCDRSHYGSCLAKMRSSPAHIHWHTDRDGSLHNRPLCDGSRSWIHYHAPGNPARFGKTQKAPRDGTDVADAREFDLVTQSRRTPYSLCRRRAPWKPWNRS